MKTEEEVEEARQRKEWEALGEPVTQSVTRPITRPNLVPFALTVRMMVNQAGWELVGETRGQLALFQHGGPQTRLLQDAALVRAYEGVLVQLVERLDVEIEKRKVGR